MEVPVLQPHVLAEPTSVSCVPQPGQIVLYDEAANVLHLVEGRMVTAVRLPLPDTDTSHSSLYEAASHTPSQSVPQHARRGSTGSSSSASSGTTSTSLRAGSDDEGFSFLASPGPPILAVKARPDGAATALQRSPGSIEILDHATGNMCVAAPARRDAALLGFLWTRCPGADFVMVTTQGLELYAMQPSKQGLTLTASHRATDVQWYVWSASPALLLCGCGSTGSKVRLWQLLPPGLAALPLLDLSPPWGSPVKSSASSTAAAQLSSLVPASPLTPDAARSTAGSTSPTPLSSIAAANSTPGVMGSSASAWAGLAMKVWVVELYGGVYVCHHDARAAVLRLYRLYRDGSRLAHELPLLGASAQGEMQVGVADNVLLVHVRGTSGGASPFPVADSNSGGGGGGVVMLIDVAEGGGIVGPLLKPQPLGLPSQMLIEEEEGELEGGVQDVEAGPCQPATPSMTGRPGSRTEVEGEWVLCFPHWLVHPASGSVMRTVLDLDAIAAEWRGVYDPHGGAHGAHQPDKLVAFLLRRRAGPGLVNGQNPKAVALKTLRLLLADSSTSDAIAGVRRCFDAVHLAAAAGRSLVIYPQEFVDEVLAPAVPALDPLSLCTVLGEYCASCLAHNMPVPPAAAILYIDAFRYAGRGHLLSALLESHAPVLDSAPAAAHLQEGCTSGTLLEGFELALRMHSRMQDHTTVCVMLLGSGRVIEALRLLQRHKVESVLPAQCLAAAAGTGDVATFAAAYRMCAAVVEPELPGFQETLAEYAECFEPQQLRSVQAT